MQAVCDTQIARTCVLIKDIGRRLSLQLQCSLYQGQQGDVSLRAEAIKPVCEGDKSDSCGRNASVYQVYPVRSYKTGEGRAEFFGAWGPGFEQEGAGGRGQAGQLNLCVETINPLRGRI